MSRDASSERSSLSSALAMKSPIWPGTGNTLEKTMRCGSGAAAASQDTARAASTMRVVMRFLSFEEADVRSFAADVSGHRCEHRGACLRRRGADCGNVEHRVEREELEDVVMRGSGGRCSGPAEVRTGRADLARAVGQLCRLRNVLRQAPGRRRNVP